MATRRTFRRRFRTVRLVVRWAVRTAILFVCLPTLLTFAHAAHTVLEWIS